MMTDTSEIGVYSIDPSAAKQRRLSLAAGLTLVVISLLGFAFALFTRVDQFAIHAFSTLPMIFAVGALTNYWRLLLTPTSLELSKSGLAIQRDEVRTDFRWNEIGWVAVSDLGMQPGKKKLTIYDAFGKTVAVVADSVDDFSGLATALQGKVKENNSSVAAAIQLKKARRTALYTILGGLFFLSSTIFMYATGRNAAQRIRLLHTEGTEAKAELIERFLAPDGVTTRIKLKATDENGGEAEHNFEVTQAYFDGIDGAQEVDVFVAKSDANACRLVEGQIESPIDNVRSNYLTAALSAAVSLALFGMSIIFWKGYDFVVSPETNTYGFRKMGEHR